MTEWNGDYKDYDYSDPRYTLENLRLHEESVEHNVEWVKKMEIQMLSIIICQNVQHSKLPSENYRLSLTPFT